MLGDSVLLQLFMLSLYILFPLHVEICVIVLMSTGIFGGYAMGELSEGYFAIRVDIHPSND